MAITNISKKHLDSLLLELNSKNIDNSKIVQSVQRNSNNYGKLKVLFKQLAFIKDEINTILNDSLESEGLSKINCDAFRIPGNHYYLYTKLLDESLYFSLLAPDEWNYEEKNRFIGKYLFDYDLNFNKVEE